jgi:hypothetical protein
MYVIGKDMPARKVFVVAGRDHPALYTRSALLHGPSWVACAPPPQLIQVCIRVGVCVTVFRH